MRQTLRAHGPSRPDRRRGLALMTMVIALAVLSMVIAATGWQLVAHRRTLEQRFHQEQAAWLARAGVERAAGRLLADPASDATESVELIPLSQLRVTVRREPGQGDTYQVTSESRFPTDSPRPVVRMEKRRLRRVLEDGRARIVVLPGEHVPPEAMP